MRETARALSAELLKLKRTLALWVSVGTPLALVFLNFVMYTRRSDALILNENPLLGFAQLSLTTWTIVVLPLYTALVAALVAAVDHQGDHWKQLLALPLPRASFFVAKWVATGGLLLVSSLVLPAAIVVAAEVLKGVKPAWRGASVPVILVTIRALQTCCAAGLILSLQLWVSLRWRSFIPGIVVGIMGIMILLGGVVRVGFGTIVIYLYPWALAPTAMARMAEVHPNRLLVSAWGVASGTLVAAFGCWHLSRLDERP